MPYVLRVTSLPTTAEIVRVPQIVVVDLTGPTIPIGISPGVVMLVGEFLKGPTNTPTEMSGSGQVTAIFGGETSLLSQDAAGTPVQNGGAKNFEGNGPFQLLGKTFKRLGICRVNTEAVTTDGGAVLSQLTLSVTVAASDQDGAGNTNKDIIIPAGTRFSNGAGTNVVATSQDLLIPKGTATAANVIAGLLVNCFFVKSVEVIVAAAIASINTIIDSAIPNVAATTTITAVNNTVAMWPPGTGTTLALRVASQYAAAITATTPGAVAVTNDVVVIWAARRTTAIRQALLANAVNSSLSGRGRIAVASCDPAAGTTPTQAAAGVTAAAALSVTESLQLDRMMLTFPQSQVTSSALGLTATINADGWMASILSNFPNEVNPGASPTETVGIDLLSSIVALEPCYAINALQKSDDAALIAGGVCRLQKDRTVGWWFLQGITCANQVTQPTRVPAKRRRMADEIQDSIAGIAAKYQKQPATTERVDAFAGELDAYLTGLLSPNDKSKQRIVAAAVDMTSLNDPKLVALGVFTIGVQVTLLSSMDDIIFVTQIGETVVVTQQAA